MHINYHSQNYIRLAKITSLGTLMIRPNEIKSRHKCLEDEKFLNKQTNKNDEIIRHRSQEPVGPISLTDKISYGQIKDMLLNSTYIKNQLVS